MSDSPTLSIGECATLACLWEATAAKPGNVHRGADFDDVSYLDFVLSAQAIGPVFDRASELNVGQLVLQSIVATRRRVRTNTNLGIVLLLAPLAKPHDVNDLRTGITDVLRSLSSDDCREVYEAIRLATPGGLGSVDKGDIHAAPPESLLDAMQTAAQRDRVAWQYAHNFADVFDRVVPWLCDTQNKSLPLQLRIVHTFVRLLAELGDTLIARKCGALVAEQASSYAAAVLRSGEPDSEAFQDALADLDFWLRADGHRRNPGTTADLIAAGLFVALRQGKLTAEEAFY